ncbi:hypothetical protein [Cellulomonas endophytica]|uniref:hypothetical protein n=1 Tax=Cellulomonas endophytica TaxID=2494735 RepID=UPI001011D69B|nr:hypothetical protein [Cellulomonas endophytica]
MKLTSTPRLGRTAASLGLVLAATLAAPALAPAPASVPASVPAAAPAAAPAKRPAPAATNAVDRHHPVVREAAENAPQYTVYRPLGVRGDLPVVVWGNGACNHATDIEYVTALSLLASHGFVVISEGYYAGAPEGVTGGVQPELLTGAIDWAERADRRGYNDLKKSLDLSRVALAGHSCGGIEALVAGDDPRVDAVLSLNSGFFPDAGIFGYGREELAELHAPVLFVDGGPEAIEYQNSRDNYALVTVPAIAASAEDAQHTGLWHNTRDDAADSTIALEADVVVTNYLDFVLNGNAAARDYFLGTSPGLAAVPGWTVESRNY